MKLGTTKENYFVQKYTVDVCGPEHSEVLMNSAGCIRTKHVFVCVLLFQAHLLAGLAAPYHDAPATDSMYVNFNSTAVCGDTHVSGNVACC